MTFVPPSTMTSIGGTANGMLREAFLRGLALLHCIAFASYLCQYDALLGHDGLLPADLFLERQAPPARGADGWDAPTAWALYAKHLPTFGWFHAVIGCSPDQLHRAVALAGALLGGLVASGRVLPPSTPVFCTLHLLYLSCVSVGQTWYSFQWDALLLETTAAAALYAAPFGRSARLRSHFAPGAWVLRWAFFKLMLMAGMVKVQAGCETWQRLTALDYHFATQCLPTPLAFYAHSLPPPMLRLGVAITLLIEVPFTALLLAPHCAARRLGVLCQAGLQLLIIATGNYGYFNALTLLLCLPCWAADWEGGGGKGEEGMRAAEEGSTRAALGSAAARSASRASASAEAEAGARAHVHGGGAEREQAGAAAAMAGGPEGRAAGAPPPARGGWVRAAAAALLGMRGERTWRALAVVWLGVSVAGMLRFGWWHVGVGPQASAVAVAGAAGAVAGAAGMAGEGAAGAAEAAAAAAAGAAASASAARPTVALLPPTSLGAVPAAWWARLTVSLALSPAELSDAVLIGLRAVLPIYTLLILCACAHALSAAAAASPRVRGGERGGRTGGGTGGGSAAGRGASVLPNGARAVRVCYTAAACACACGLALSSAVHLRAIARPLRLPHAALAAYRAGERWRLTSGYGLFRKMTGVGRAPGLSARSGGRAGAAPARARARGLPGLLGEAGALPPDELELAFEYGWGGLPPSVVSRPEVILELSADNGSSWQVGAMLTAARATAARL